MTNRTAGEDSTRSAWAVLLLAVAAGVAAAYGNVVFAGGSLLYSNALNSLDGRPLAQNYGPEARPAELWSRRNLQPNANLHDAGATWWQWEPAARLLRRTWREDRELPWWDPYSGGGTPGLANPTGTPFFPPYLAVVLASDSPAARTFYFVLLQIGAAFALALLLRRHGLSRTASVVGGLGFALSGGMAQNVGSLIGQTLACAPFALLATAWFLDRPGARRGVGLAAVYAAVSLSSFPPMVVVLFGYVTVYTIVRLFGERPAREWRLSVATAARWAGFAALAVALAAFYLLPVRALVSAAPHFERMYDRAHSARIPPGNLLQLTSPTLLGGQKILVKPWIDARGPEMEIPYVGAVLLGLVGFAASGGRAGARRLLVASVASLAFVAAKCLGLPPTGWLTDLPVLRQVHFVPYLGHTFGLPLAVLAALGWDAALRRPASLRRIGAVSAMLAAWAFVIWVVADDRGALSKRTAGEWRTEMAVVCALLAAPLLAACLSRARRHAPTLARVAPLLVLAVFVAEGVRNTWYPRQVRWDFFGHPSPFVEHLQREVGLGRVFAFRTFSANLGSGFGISQLESVMAFNSPRMHELYAAAAWKQTRSLFMTTPDRIPPSPFLARAAVRFVAVSSRTPGVLAELEGRGGPKVFDDGFNRLFERRALPRFSYTSRYVVSSPEQARVAALNDRQLRRIWLEERPAFRSRANRPSDPPVEVVEFRANSYRLRVRAPRPGLVYCAESQMPGWRATVDGRAAPILAANYAFRAVEVPKGESVVEMVYHPPGLPAGVWISGIALAVAALLLVRGRPAA